MFPRALKVFHRLPKFFPNIPKLFHELHMLFPKVFGLFCKLFHFSQVVQVFLKIGFMAFCLGCLGFFPKVFKLFHKLLRFFHRLFRLFLKMPNVGDGFDVTWVVIVVKCLSTIYTQYHQPQQLKHVTSYRLLSTSNVEDGTFIQKASRDHKISVVCIIRYEYSSIIRFRLLGKNYFAPLLISPSPSLSLQTFK